MQGNASHERTAALRQKIREALLALGVTSYCVAFSDPDTLNWTWGTGDNDPEALGMSRIMASEVEKLLTE